MARVFITGASRGIGSALASIFAKGGYDLILSCDKNYNLLKADAKELFSKYGITITIVRYDKNQNKFLVEQTYGNNTDGIYFDEKENNIKTDILINNASKALYGLFQDTKEEEWNEIINSNLTTMFHASKSVLQYMIHEKKGLIVNISSIWGIVGASLETIYSGTKGFVNTFTKALAKELEPSKIDVIAFALGMVDTEMNSYLSDEEKNEIAKSLDGGKLFTKEEIAQKIFEHATNKNFKTGSIISLDNGLVNL